MKIWAGGEIVYDTANTPPMALDWMDRFLETMPWQDPDRSMEWNLDHAHLDTDGGLQRAMVDEINRALMPYGAQVELGEHVLEHLRFLTVEHWTLFRLRWS